MAESTTTPETEAEGGTAAAEQSSQGERTFTQEEVNRMVGDARKKVREQYKGYVSAEDAAEAARRADEAEAELAGLRAQAARDQAVAAAAEAAKLPAEVVRMLNGKDAEELGSQAARLLELLPAYPERTDDGGGHVTAKKGIADRFIESLGDRL